MDNQDELFNQAVAAEDAGNLLLARELYEKCLSIDGSFARGWLCYGSLLKEQRKYSEAIQAAINAAEHCVADSSMFASAHSMIGQCYMKQELWLQAEEAFHKSQSIELKATTAIFLGFTLQGLGREEEAIESYQAALKLEPENDEAHYNVGCCYRLRGDYERAIPHFRRAIAADSNYSIAYAELGFSLARLGADASALLEARSAVEKSVVLDPDYGWSRLYLGNIMWRLGENQSAEEQYEAAIRIWPDSEVAHLSFAQFLAGTTDDRMRIKRHFKKAIACDPDYASALYHFGGNLLNWNRRKEGERFLKRAAELGHKQAKTLLAGLAPYVPKPERWPACPDCGAPWKQTGTWWCLDCGNDMRSKAIKRKPDVS